MANKKINLLASTIFLTSSAQASFDSDTLVFVAVNHYGDSYVADLGNVDAFLNGGIRAVNPVASEQR